MSTKVNYDYSKAMQFIGEQEIVSMCDIVENAKEVLVSKSGAGNDFLGWIDLPVDYDKEEFDRIIKAAEKIKSDSDVLLVIGIGGSYLGARAAIEFLRHSFYNVIPKELRKTPEIYFVGNSISSTYIKHLMDVIGDRDFSINMISKSGTTTEPAIAFRVSISSWSRILFFSVSFSPCRYHSSRLISLSMESNSFRSSDICWDKPV